MGFFQRWHERQVNNAIGVLSTTKNKFIAKGAVNTLIKHSDADPSAIPYLVDLAVKHPDPALCQLAENGLRKIVHTHKDPAVRERAQKALNQLTASSCSCQLK
jgi:hypothetical protein